MNISHSYLSFITKLLIIFAISCTWGLLEIKKKEI